MGHGQRVVVWHWYLMQSPLRPRGRPSDASSRRPSVRSQARAICRSTSNCSARCATPSTGTSSAPTMRCRPSATWRPISASRASPCARPSTGSSSEGLLVRRQGSGTFVRGRVEKNFSMLTSFSEDMRARGRNPRSDWLKRIERNGHAGGSADAALESGHAGVPLSPAAIRGRRADGARVRDDRRRLPAVARRRRDLAVRGAGARRQPARARAAAPARRAAHARAGRAAAREAGRRGPAGRAARASCRTGARSSSRSPSIAATPTTSSPSSARP